MNKTDLIKLILDLPDNIDITVQTCSYDGTSEVYDDQEPRFITNNDYAILTGERDFWGQSYAARELCSLSSKEVVTLLGEHVHIVKVD
jgi:hypothetical protein